MRKILTATFLCSCLFLHAQITGTKTIGIDYPTLAAAVNALNTQGVGGFGAIIDIPTGYVETVPSGGLILGSSTLNPTIIWPNPGFNKRLLFRKSGSGANPILRAYTGGTSATTDGIFKILGADNVSLDGIDLEENSANSGNALMEWGVAFLNLNSPANIDGCKRDTIRNCRITLNRLNPNRSYGIFSKHVTLANPTTILKIVGYSDSHGEITIIGNKISNVTTGIYFSGEGAPGSDPDYPGFHNIGLLDNGNIIENFGGVTNYPSYGIWIEYNRSTWIARNTIDNIAGGGVANGNTELVGVKVKFDHAGWMDKDTIRLTTFSNNFLTAGFYFEGNGLFEGNVIETFDGGDSGPHYGIYSQAITNGYSLNMMNNRFKASNLAASTSHYYFLYATGSTAQSIIMTDNKIDDMTLNTGGTISFCYNAGTADLVHITFNSLKNFTSPSLSGTFRGIFSGNSITSTDIRFNTIDSVKFTGQASGGTIIGILTGQFVTSMLISNNTLSRFYVPGAGGAIFGIDESSLATTKEISSNDLFNFYTTPGGIGGSSISGIYSTSGSNSLTVRNNRVYRLKNNASPGGPAADITGIRIDGGPVNEIFANTIFDLSTNSSPGSVSGIMVTGGTDNTFYNNLVGVLNAPFSNTATDMVRGINLLNTNPNSCIKLYHNTIYLNSNSSGANFGASGVFHTASNVATTANLSMRNNIIYNNSVAKGTGLVAAFRRSDGTAGMLANYNNSSNNNLFYAGNPGPSQLIYYDGTSAAQSICTYRSGIFTAGTIAPRDNFSVTEAAIPFLNTNLPDPIFLHLNSTIPTVVESGGTAVTGLPGFATDYDGQVRSTTTPDIGADEIPGIAALPCSGTPSAGTITGSNNICPGSNATLSLGSFSGSPNIYIQWKSSPVSGGPYFPISGANNSTYNTGVINSPGSIYYVATLTCSFSCFSATTPEFSLTINPTPNVNAVPAQSFCPGITTSPISFTGSINNSTFNWANNNTTIGLAASGTGNIPSFNTLNNATPANVATITVTPTYTNGTTTCTGATTSFSITINPRPVVTITAQPDSLILPGQTATLIATGTPAGGNYQWYKNNNVIAGASGPSFGTLNINDLGVYKVAYSINNCSSFSTVISLGGVSSPFLYIFPNPNNGQFQVRFYNQPGQIISLVVFNALGQKVFEQSPVTGSLPYTPVNVNLGFKATGVYVVKLINSNGTSLAVKRIIVHSK